MIFLQTFQSKSFSTENLVNEAVLKHCDKDLTYEIVEGKLLTFYRWTAANPSLVRPSFFQKERVINDFQKHSIQKEPFNPSETGNFSEFDKLKDESSLLEVCFCNHQYLVPDLQDQRIGNLCSINVNQSSKILFIQILSGALISVVNFVFLKIIPLLVAFLPLKSLTSQSTWIILLSVIILYINSVVIPIFIHSPSFINFLKIKFQDIDHSFLGGIVVHLDFDHLWYANVGTKISISLIFNFFISTIIEIFRIRAFKL